MTDGPLDARDEFVLRGGKRSSLRNRALLLAAIAVVAIVVLVGTFEQPTSEDSGSVGHIVIPLAVAIASLLGLVISAGQWWEDVTYFAAATDRVRVSHGAGRLRGRSLVLDTGEPVTVHGEAARGGYVLFLDRDGVRVRLGDASALAPAQTARLDAWLRAQGAAVEHLWDRI